MNLTVMGGDGAKLQEMTGDRLRRMAAQTTAMPAPKAAEDVFVVQSAEGYWDGQGWVADWRLARRFAEPNPYSRCNAEAERIETMTGTSCSASYHYAPFRAGRRRALAA